jgi:mono/diheme cytochrome c family protein
LPHGRFSKRNIPFRLWRWIINSSSRIRKTLALTSLATIALIAGCRQDMHNQPKEYPQRGTDFFADGRSVRPQALHTVARSQTDMASYFHTGLQDGKEQDYMPFPVTAAVMARGQEQYNVYCTPCHSRVGNGAGMIVQRGYKPAGNFHDARVLGEPISHYYYVIAYGFGAMPDYAAQITTEDRWAIAAYMRALQLSQNAKAADVPSGEKIDDLADVAQQQGLPVSFAQPWAMPGTAVYAQPGTTYPGMAPSSSSGNPWPKNRPILALPNGDSLQQSDVNKGILPNVYPVDANIGQPSGQPKTGDTPNVPGAAGMGPDARAAKTPTKTAKKAQ